MITHHSHRHTEVPIASTWKCYKSQFSRGEDSAQHATLRNLMIASFLWYLQNCIAHYCHVDLLLSRRTDLALDVSLIFTLISLALSIRTLGERTGIWSENEKWGGKSLALPECGTGYFPNGEIHNGLLISISDRGVYDYDVANTHIYIHTHTHNTHDSWATTYGI